MIKICISVTSYALDPLPPVTNCHIFLDPSPLERDVLYGRPLINLSINLNSQYNAIDIQAEQWINEGGMSREIVLGGMSEEVGPIKGDMSRGKCPRNVL